MNALKRYLVGWCCVVVGLLTQSAVANNLVVTNVTIKSGDVGYTFVQADVSWDNSWKAKWEEPFGTTNVNWDAAWIFVKYRVATNGAHWSHASLSTNNSEHVVPAGATNVVGLSLNAGGTNFGCGVFLYRSAEGQGNWSNTVKLRWNYAQDGVANTSSVDVSVQAIEMVYVPQGGFKVGTGAGESGCFTAGGSTTPFAITSEDALMITNNVGALWGTITNTSLGNTIGSAGTLPLEYPKGHKSFYCMKYEITQGQWVDFFNLLTDFQKATRDITGGTYNSTGKGTDADTNRNTIVWTSGDATCATPDRACNFLSWDDGVAYADWAGLRPMTELEFEKACRGPAEPVSNEFAWGTATIMTGTINLTVPEDGTETNTTTAVALGAANYGPTKYIQTNGVNAGMGPIRAGLFATAASTRITSGATFWGIMEMSGNLYEPVVTVGHNTGRLFTGATGDGTLDSTGYAHYGFWPNATAVGAGFRGGDWVYGSANSRTSDRNLAASVNIKRYNNLGFRAVR